MSTNRRRWTHPEEDLERIQLERLRQSLTLADELQFEHDFGYTPSLAEQTTKPEQAERNQDA